MRKRIKLGNRWIGEDEYPFIVAEIGGNHQGDIKTARKLILEASKVGVDAVKFQKKDIETCFPQDLLDSPYTGNNSFGATYREHKQALELSPSQLVGLKCYAESLGLQFFATPFDIKSVEDLEYIGVKFYKVSSFHVTNHKLITKICQTRKPIIMSTGMSTLEEVDRAVDLINKHGNPLALLHCISCYPCNEEDMNLRVIQTLQERYGCPVGYSGHEKNVSTCIATVMLGACIIERHFTLDRTMKGTDHAMSVEPQGMEMIVKRSKAFSRALGNPEKKVYACELPALRKNR